MVCGIIETSVITADGDFYMKKIAIIADGWRRYINYAWISGCRQYIREHGLDVDIYAFHSFGNFSRDEKYNDGEYNIANLPDFSKFDGILVELTNVSRQQFKTELIARIRASKVPAVSLVERIPGLYYSGIDNYAAMEKLVEHLIVKHGCKTLNYAGGPEQNGENKERFRAYRDVLQRHGIPVEEKRILHRDYEIETGEWAFEFFKKQGELPDAFVCANDNIAVGLCKQAKDEGYQIPGDFLVTGFDDFDKASYFEPRITTAGFARETIAYNAAELLHRIWNGEKDSQARDAKIHWNFQDSCGCVPEHPLSRGEYVTNRIFGEVAESNMLDTMMDLKRRLLDCSSYVEMAECFPNYLSGLECQEMYILMNRDFVQMEEADVLDENAKERYITTGYPEEMEVVLASRNGEVYHNVKKEPGELVPHIWDQKHNNLYLFAPIHFRDREVGYFVFQNCDYMLDNQFLFQTLNAFQEALESLYGKLVLRRMNKKLSLLYIMDSLTGLYNRMAYDRLAVPLYESCMKTDRSIMIMFVDVDRLKYINDTFGHDMGNLAISSTAAAIRECCPQSAVAMRYGGDEFVVLVPDYGKDEAKKLRDTITETLQKMACGYHAEFPIEASIGYAIAQPGEKSLNDWIDEADEKMYEVKKARKVERKK